MLLTNAERELCDGVLRLAKWQLERGQNLNPTNQEYLSRGLDVALDKVFKMIRAGIETKKPGWNWCEVGGCTSKKGFCKHVQTEKYYCPRCARRINESHGFIVVRFPTQLFDRKDDVL